MEFSAIDKKFDIVVGGQNITFTKITADEFKLTATNSDIVLNCDDIRKLEELSTLLIRSSDRYVFNQLRFKVKTELEKAIKAMDDELLLSFSKFIDENPFYYKRDFLLLRTELFTRNGLSKANHKLTFKQKAFLYSVGLKRD